MEPEKLSTLTKIAKSAADMVLANAFVIYNKFPISGWSYDLTTEGAEMIKTIPDKELANHVLGNMDLVKDLIEEAMANKLAYLFTEGFTYKKKGNYVFYTQDEIDDQIRCLLGDDKDSI